MTGWSRATEDQAIDWLIRQRDDRFDDWEAFEAWLATDEHARAYDQLAADERDLGDLLTGVEWPAEPEVEAPVRPARRYWLGGAVAASLAVAVSAWTLWPSRDLYTIETKGGERRIVALNDVRVDMNGATRITFDRKDQRYAKLENGQAVFVVRHDDAHPFKLDTREAKLVDAGTTFEVTSDSDGLDVAVSEGLILVDPDSAGIRVPAGQRFLLQAGERTGKLSAVRPSDVGGWRSGQLFYDGAPLSRVAADLRRSLGIAKVEVSPDAARRQFSGVIRLDGGVPATIERLRLLGITVTRTPDGRTVIG